MFQILDGLCTPDVQVVVTLVKSIFTLVQIAIPGVLIVLGTIDMFKAMASGDEKKTKEAQRTFIRRISLWRHMLTNQNQYSQSQMSPLILLFIIIKNAKKFIKINIKIKIIFK